VIFEALRQKSRAFKSIFSGPEGQKALKALQDEFDQLNIMSETPEKTAYKLGQRDVVKYIEQLIHAHEKLENDDAT
jgi:hypothetical protein